MNHPDRTSYTSKNAIDLSFPGRIPLWYEAKLLLVAWLVLPQFKGASFIYEKLVRDQLRKYRARHLRMGAAAADDQKVHLAKVGKDSTKTAALFFF